MHSEPDLLVHARGRVICLVLSWCYMLGIELVDALQPSMLHVLVHGCTVVC